MMQAIAMGLLGGITAVYVFNKIPPKWLVDYDQEPSKAMWSKRLKEAHFIPLFSSFLIWAAHTIQDQETPYLIAGFIAIWILLLIAVADYKYMIIPDQFTIGLAIVSIGLIPYHTSILSPLAGALIGGGFLLAVGLIGHFILKKETMGFGDVKLMTAIGILSGFKGSLLILFLSIMSSGLVLSFLLILKKVKQSDEKPLGPFIAISTMAYILFKKELFLIAAFLINY